MASKYPSFFNLCEKWTDFFYSTDIENVLMPILNELEEESKYYPDDNSIFRCFYMTPFDNINVVILGQDPYHNGSATGLCFDVKLGNSLNPSLQNIYKELESEGFYPVKDGNLESWTKQGVLLLNTALTVSPSEPESHLELWSSFSKKIIEKISEKDFVIWVILGKKAADWKEYITNKNHIVLEATHPSPFSALKDSGSQRAFIGSGIFKSVNGELLKRGFEKISW
jgi:uracil-DNA glycosylase